MHGFGAMENIPVWKKRMADIAEVARAQANGQERTVQCTPATTRHDLEGTLQACALSMGPDEPAASALQGCLEDIGECTCVFELKPGVSDDVIKRIEHIINKGTAVEDETRGVRYETAVAFLSQSDADVVDHSIWMRACCTFSSDRSILALAKNWNEQQNRVDYYLVVRNANIVGCSLVHAALAKKSKQKPRAITISDLYDTIKEAEAMSHFGNAMIAARINRLLGLDNKGDTVFAHCEDGVPPARFASRYRDMNQRLPVPVSVTPTVFVEHHREGSVFLNETAAERYVFYRQCTVAPACTGAVAVWDLEGGILSLAMDKPDGQSYESRLSRKASAPRQKDSTKRIVLAAERPAAYFFKELRQFWRNLRASKVARERYSEQLQRDARRVRRRFHFGMPAGCDGVTGTQMQQFAMTSADFHGTSVQELKLKAVRAGSRHLYSVTPFDIFLDAVYRTKDADYPERFLVFADKMDPDSLQWQEGVQFISSEEAHLSDDERSPLDERFLYADRVMSAAVYNSRFVAKEILSVCANCIKGTPFGNTDVSDTAAMFVTFTNGVTVMPWMTVEYAYSQETRDDKSAMVADAVDYIEGKGPFLSQFENSLMACIDVHA